MNRTISPYGPSEWDEAQRRAETYLRALHGEIGSAERGLLANALAKARVRSRRENLAHPVPLVMESLFDLLPPQKVPPSAMTPPLRRVKMIPERMEFPFHDAMRTIFQSEVFPFGRRPANQP